MPCRFIIIPSHDRLMWGLIRGWHAPCRFYPITCQDHDWTQWGTREQNRQAASFVKTYLASSPKRITNDRCGEPTRGTGTSCRSYTIPHQDYGRQLWGIPPGEPPCRAIITKSPKWIATDSEGEPVKGTSVSYRSIRSPIGITTDRCGEAIKGAATSCRF